MAQISPSPTSALARSQSILKAIGKNQRRERLSLRLKRAYVAVIATAGGRDAGDIEGPHLPALVA